MPARKLRAAAAPGLIWPLLVFLLVTLLTLGVSALDTTWLGWRPASCWPDHCFCEARRAGPVAQPVNAYSNLAYVLAGLLILGAAAQPPGRAFRAVYGAALVAIGLGSFFYHASLTFAGQWFDVMGMYLLAVLLVLHNLSRLRPLPGFALAAGYLAVNALLGVVLVVAPEARRYIFGGLIAGALALEGLVHLARRPRIKIACLIAALAAMAAAYAIWILDNAGWLCAPSSWLQGHAAWHILSAGAAGWLYLYYASERD